MTITGTLLRALMLALGVMLVIAGGLWTLQGLGIVRWPEESFMLADRQWAVTGAITMLVGAALIGLRRRCFPKEPR